MTTGGITEPDTSWAATARARVPAPIAWPDELAGLCEFVEEQGWLFPGRVPGEQVGGLWRGQGPGTRVALRIPTVAERRDEVSAFLRVPTDDPVTDTVCPFARIGSDGAQAALWLHAGEQAIVRMGDTNRLLTREPVDFLRLLAVGYAFLDVEELAMPPDPPSPSSGERFRAWLRETYDVGPPVRGADLLPLGSLDVSYAGDPFELWVEGLRTLARPNRQE